MLWQRAQEFAAELMLLTRELPRDRECDITCRQLLRAGTSIAANIAEGYGRYSQAAYRNHLSIARGSAFETESWIDLLVRTSYLPPIRGEELIATCKEVQKLVTSRMKMLSQGKTYAVKDDALSYSTE